MDMDENFEVPDFIPEELEQQEALRNMLGLNESDESFYERAMENIRFERPEAMEDMITIPRGLLMDMVRSEEWLVAGWAILLDNPMLTMILASLLGEKEVTGLIEKISKTGAENMVMKKLTDAIPRNK